MARIAAELARHSNRLAVTSISRSNDDLEGTCDRLNTGNAVGNSGGGETSIFVKPSSELPWRQPVTVGMAVRDQWDSQVTIPVSVTDDGTSRMAAPLPPPALLHAELATRPDLEWQVDVQWQPGRAVRRRGLDSRELFTDHLEFMPTWTRSSRYGMTYQSRRYDFVLAGIRPENTRPRLKLRDLSLAAWSRAKAGEHDLATRPSEPGRRTGLLASMLGGRRQYAALFGGSTLPALRAMQVTSATTSKAYPDGNGVSLSSTEGVLTFAGICTRAAGLDSAEVRERVDEALRAGCCAVEWCYCVQPVSRNNFRRSTRSANAGNAPAAMRQTTSIDLHGNFPQTNRNGSTTYIR